MEPLVSARNVLAEILKAKPGERALAICDETKVKICEAFKEAAEGMGLRFGSLVMKVSGVRSEIPREVADALASSEADILLNLVEGRSEETPFRISLLKAEGKRARIGHCPGITMDMLTDGALALDAAGYEEMRRWANRLMNALKGSDALEIRNDKGTNLRVSVAGRSFFTDAWIQEGLKNWVNLPAGEVIVAPVEDSVEGKLVCDLAVGGVGRLSAPAVLTIQKGRVTAMEGGGEARARIANALATDEASNLVGEFAIGINPRARPSAEFLEAEKVFGTCHLAFGNNSDMPGEKNNSRNHMDFLFSKPIVDAVKGNRRERLVENGVIFQDIDWWIPRYPPLNLPPAQGP